MNQDQKIKQLIDAAQKKEGFVVEKIARTILASKINNLIEEKKKQIKLA